MKDKCVEIMPIAGPQLIPHLEVACQGIITVIKNVYFILSRGVYVLTFLNISQHILIFKKVEFTAQFLNS